MQLLMEEMLNVTSGMKLSRNQNLLVCLYGKQDWIPIVARN